MSSKFEKLKTLLRELFQLDQPDLDFGLYRIMHAKAAEVTAFLEKDLLPQVKAEFGQYQTADKAELQKELDKFVAGLKAAEVDPETSPKVKDLRAKLKNDAVDIAGLENDVYDHLLSFFSRYYSDGDFVSKRKYSKDGKYAIPYDGEEVKLFWANHDQYYIKTSEYLRDYAFCLKPDDDAKPMRVHFRLADVAEGEHGNVKTAAGKERRFVLCERDFLNIDNDELIIRFEYKPFDGKVKQSQLIADAIEKILNHENTKDEIPTKSTEDSSSSVSSFRFSAFRDSLAALSPTEKNPKRTMLEKHLIQYTARNTFDYFIHKDLGGFLKRELDFFIKNEVMMLDDIENETAPRVEQYLSKIKVFRRIAGKIIAFLAQLEDFQKALWLKKKFVVETQYCVALKEIPDEFLPEIVASAAQWAEWESLYHLSGLKKDDDGLFAKKMKLKSPEFLKANPSLMIDTRHFDATFTARLLDALGDIDAKTDGVLFHSENFQALSLMHARYRERMNCVYIDPPYNTGNDGFMYRDNYEHSSWLSMIEPRMELARSLISTESVVACSLDDKESFVLNTMLTSRIALKRIGEFVWRTRNTDNRVLSMLSVDHEYIWIYSIGDGKVCGRVIDRSDFKNPDNDKRGVYTTDPLTGKANATDRPNLHYTVTNPDTGDVYPPDPDFGWITDREGFQALIDDKRVAWPKNPKSGNPRKKRFLTETDERAPVSSLAISIKQGEGNTDLSNVLGGKAINFPKPVSVISSTIDFCSPQDSTILDFFAGSGTTGHAVIDLNRAGGGRRRFVLVEMAEYFDAVPLLRLKKICFTPEWKDGQPKRLATAEEAERGPRVFKIVRLESYEDTLNNLELKRSPGQQSLLDAAEAQGADKLREQYLLQYLLKVETRGSPSLLNVAAFTDPTAYKLIVKRPGSDESREVNVDLLETFNWLLGLTVEHINVPQAFTAEFKRDKEGRLRGKIKQIHHHESPKDESAKKTKNGSVSDFRVSGVRDDAFWIRTVTGTMPDGRKALVIWRKLTGTPEEDNLVLDEWFTKAGYSSKDSEFGLIYVNGGNNLENLKTPDDTWKVRLIEDDFQRLMFAAEGV